MIFGAGTDIIEVQRVEEKLIRTEHLKTKLFTPIEIAYCESKHRPALHFAARFAAKEAFLKAMGTGWSGGHQFSEVEVAAIDPLASMAAVKNEDLGAVGLEVREKLKAVVERL